MPGFIFKDTLKAIESSILHLKGITIQSGQFLLLFMHRWLLFSIGALNQRFILNKYSEVVLFTDHFHIVFVFLNMFI